MDRFRITAEQIDLCDGSDIRMTHYRLSSTATWLLWDAGNGIACHAEIAAGEPDAVRVVCERLADGYEPMLAFVQFGIAMFEPVQIVCCRCECKWPAADAQDVGDIYMVGRGTKACGPCADELVAQAHFDDCPGDDEDKGRCHCASCRRARASADRYRIQSRVGFSGAGLRLLGLTESDL